MATIKIKVSNTVESEKEIKLPHYRKSLCNYFKIFSQEHCIKVCDLERHYEIGISHAGLAFSNNNTEETTEEEFNHAFERINRIIINQKDGINNA